MILKNELSKKGVTEQQSNFVTQGFLELLSSQLSCAAEKADSAVGMFQEKQPDQALAVLETIERDIINASFSHKTASLLMEKGDKSKQKVLSNIKQQLRPV